MGVLKPIICIFTLGWALNVSAETIRVAVASNFAYAMKELAVRFEARTGHRIVLAFGSTGKHYAQIRHGAPFDAFFAADEKRPRLLEEKRRAVPGTRFTYAFGRLVLWSPVKGYVDAQGQVLKRADFRYLALANPRLAPYGRAAKEVLEGLDLWENLRGKMVFGENVGQAFQLVQSGNASLGFVALAQVKRLDGGGKGSLWIVPPSLYAPIEQQAVLLKDKRAARDLLSYVRSDEARKVIENFGYGVP